MNKKHSITIIFVAIFVCFLIVIINKNKTMTISSFTQLPKTQGAGGCAYYLNNQDRKNHEYLFVEDDSTRGYAFINNHNEIFGLENYDAKKDVIFYGSDKYNLQISTIRSIKFDDNFLGVEGILTVIDKKNNQKISIQIVGGCAGGNK